MRSSPAIESRTGDQPSPAAIAHVNVDCRVGATGGECRCVRTGAARVTIGDRSHCMALDVTVVMTNDHPTRRLLKFVVPDDKIISAHVYIAWMCCAERRSRRQERSRRSRMARKPCFAHAAHFESRKPAWSSCAICAGSKAVEPTVAIVDGISEIDIALGTRLRQSLQWGSCKPLPPSWIIRSATCGASQRN